ncbi:MAG: 3-dehydroquinate synthase [Gammaproteobacteria bacterium]
MHDSLPIFLVGPMGSGKSAVGKRLSAILEREFIDTDRVVEERSGVEISLIFDKEGESGFRQRETAALEYAMSQSAVVATGGGIVTQACNRQLLSATGIVVFLHTTPEQQYERTRYNNARPLLDVDNPLGRLKELWKERSPLYQELAHIVIETDGKRVPQVAKTICQELKRLNVPLANVNIDREDWDVQNMQTLTVNLGARSYPIVIGNTLMGDESLWKQLAIEVKLPRHLVIVTNTTVAPLYLDKLTSALTDHRIDHVELDDGEQHKHLATFERILNKLVECGAQRDTAIVALGGGVVGDMAGFAAASFMRGIRFVQVPTTLLAQVDSSVGGKTGVNHPLGKNLIGAFHQPEAVVIDTDTLSTLAPREVRAGLAEVIKYGCIFDGDFFTWLEKNMANLVALDAEVLTHAIHRSCAIKAEIVARDEREKGERALLNFGHSFGHAIEQVTAYKQWLHGEAVAIGMLMAAHLSQSMGQLDDASVARLLALTKAAGLPTSAGNLELAALKSAMQKDKKNTSDQQRLIVLKGIGASEVRGDCENELVDAALKAYCIS